MSLSEKTLLHLHFPIPVEPEYSHSYLRQYSYMLSLCCSAVWIVLTGTRYFLFSKDISLGAFVITGLIADSAISVSTGITLVKNIKAIRSLKAAPLKTVKPVWNVGVAIFVSLFTAGINLSLASLLRPVYCDVSLELGVHIFSLELDAAIIMLGLAVSLFLSFRKKPVVYRGGRV